MGCLPTSDFFYAFELGTKQKDQVVSIEPSSRSSKISWTIQLILRGLSNRGLVKTLIGIKAKVVRPIGVSFLILFKRGISSKVFTFLTPLALGGFFLGRGTLGT